MLLIRHANYNPCGVFNMSKKKQKKSMLLPKYGSKYRYFFIRFLDVSDSYKETIEKGYPFYTRQELDEIQKRYIDGLTWDDVDRELVKKGIFLKKATFRKYIIDGYLPRAISYRKTTTGRVAVFPSDIVTHINLIQYYYKVITGDIIDDFIDSFANMTHTYYEAINECLSKYSDSVEIAIADYLAVNNVDIENAIERVFANKPNDLKKVMGMLKRIENKYHSLINPEIDKFIAFLNNNEIKRFEFETETEFKKDKDI